MERTTEASGYCGGRLLPIEQRHARAHRVEQRVAFRWAVAIYVGTMGETIVSVPPVAPR